MPSNRGYFAGYRNYFSVVYSTAIDYITFDTKVSGTSTATLGTGRNQMAGVNSNVVGYFCGGTTGAYSSVINGVTFSTEAFKSVTSVLTAARAYSGGISSSTKGYICGGTTGSANGRIDALTFSNETVALLGASFASGLFGHATFSSTNYGYNVYGVISTYDPNMYRLSFANETLSTIAAKSIQNRYLNVGTFSNNCGYVCGSDGYTKLIDRFNFITETNGHISALLTQGRKQLGQSNSQTDGFLAGGQDSSNHKSSIEQLNFSNETVTLLNAQLFENTNTATGITPTQQIAATATDFSVPTLTSGYTLGGSDRAVNTSSSEKMLYSTETYVPISATTSVVNVYSQSHNSNVAGYVHNGTTGGGTAVNILRFDDDTVQNKGINLTVAKDNACGISGQIKGYYLGGSNGSTRYATIDGIVYATNTNANTSSVLGIAQDGAISGYSNSNGYAVGGYNATSGYQGDIHKIAFSNEAVTNTVTSLTRFKHCSGGLVARNNIYAIGGYAGPGPNTHVTDVDKFNYSNETATTVNIYWSVAHRYLTGNAGHSDINNVGYLAGGYLAGTALPSFTIYKLDYASESQVNTNASLNTARMYCTSVSTSVQAAPTDSAMSTPASGTYTKGYIAGGANKYTSSNINKPSIVDAIDYNTDSTSLITAHCLARNHMAGFNSSVAGYIAGGDTGVPLKVIEKLRFDTEVLYSVKSVLPVSRYSVVGTNSTTKGYIAGGHNGTAQVNTITALTFSNDVVANLSAVLTTARERGASPHNANVTFFMAGNGASGNVNKFNHSNETISTNSKVLTDKYGVATTNSNNTGYSTGGYNTYKTTESVDFTSDILNLLNITLSTGKGHATGISSTTKGYIAGGWDGSIDYKTVDTINFANCSITQSGATISNARDSAVGITTIVPSTPTYTAFVPNTMSGYNFLANNNVYGVDKFPYATEVSSATSYGMSTYRRNASGFNSSLRGYYCGGYNTFATIDTIRFNTDEVYQLNSVLSVARYNTGSVASATKGYTVGGNTGTVSNKIDATTFATDACAVIAAVLSTASEVPVGVSTTDKGHIHNGAQSQTTFGTFLFSTETYALQSATLETNDYGFTSTQSPDFGVFAAGNNNRLRLTKFDFSTLSIATLNCTFVTSSGKLWGSGMSNTTAGYFAGGLNQTTIATRTIDKFNVSSLTCSAVTSRTSSLCAYSVGITTVVQTAASAYVNPSVPTSQKAYFCGGYDQFGALSKTIDIIDIASKTNTNSKYVLQQAKQYLSGCNSSIKGYLLGSTTPTTGSVESIRFDNDSLSKLNLSLTTARGNTNGTSSNEKGYILGGAGSVSQSVITGINFTSEVLNDLSVTLSSAKYSSASFASNAYSYVAGGTPITSSIEKLSHGIAAISTIAAVLPTASQAHSAIETVDYGYIIGGSSTGTGYAGSLSTINRVSFVTDTLFTVSNTLALAKYFASGASFSDYGYIAGGYSGTDTIEQFDPVIEGMNLYINFLSVGKYLGSLLSNYNAKTSIVITPRALFANQSVVKGLYFASQTVYTSSATMYAMRGPGGISAPSAGYIGGGYSGTYNVIKIAASDDSSYSLSFALATSRNYIGTIQSTTNGYWLGGYQTFNEIDGVIFATDAYNNPAAALSAGTYGVGGINSPTKGYAGGGNLTGQVIHAFTFASETCTTLSETLSIVRNFPAGFGTSIVGYWACGGASSGAGAGSTSTDKFTYDTETRSTISAVTSVAFTDAVGVTSTTNGYVTGSATHGGADAGISSLLYSNESYATLGVSIGFASYSPGGISFN